MTPSNISKIDNTWEELVDKNNTFRIAERLVVLFEGATKETVKRSILIALVAMDMADLLYDPARMG